MQRVGHVTHRCRGWRGQQGHGCVGWGDGVAGCTAGVGAASGSIFSIALRVVAARMSAVGAVKMVMAVNTIYQDAHLHGAADWFASRFGRSGLLRLYSVGCSQRAARAAVAAGHHRRAAKGFDVTGPQFALLIMNRHYRLAAESAPTCLACCKNSCLSVPMVWRGERAMKPVHARTSKALQSCRGYKHLRALVPLYSLNLPYGALAPVRMGPWFQRVLHQSHAQCAGRHLAHTRHAKHVLARLQTSIDRDGQVARHAKMNPRARWTPLNVPQLLVAFAWLGL